MPSFDIAGRRSYQGDVLSLPLPYVRCLLSHSRMCLERYCCGHPVHVSQVGGCPHMCPWVGPHAPSFGRQLWGLPSRVEYLSPQGVLLPLVYGTTASPLRLELRGNSAWQATPSTTVYRLTYHRLLPWLRVTFAMVPHAAWPGSDQWPLSTAPATGPVGRLGRPSASDPWGVGSFLSLGLPTCLQCPGPLGSCSPVSLRGLLCCVCGVLGHLAPVHRCARAVCCVASAVSWATWLLFTGVLARCVVLLCGVLGHLAPVLRCACWVCCVACAVSPATWPLFTGVPARCVVLRVRCPWPLGSCSPVCPLGVLFCVWCTGPPGSCSPVCLLGVLCCVCGVLGHLAPVLQCARWVCCTVCGVLGHLAPVQRCACSVVALRVRCPGPLGFLFTGVPAPWVVLRVRCPGSLGSCSPVRPLGVLCCVCGVLGHLAPVHRCAHSVCCFACAVSWASWLLFTGVPARCVVLRVRCPRPLGSCSPVCPLRVLFCVCGVPGLLAPVHRCACSVCCVVCAVSWATWLLFTVAPAPCVVLRVRCPRPLGSRSPVCLLGVLCCVCGVLGHLAPAHRCARSVLCFDRALSWATWLPFTGVPARCVALRVRCPVPPGSCSPVCPLRVLCCVYGVLGH